MGKKLTYNQWLDRANRAITMTIESFTKNNLAWIPVALSFFTTMAFIPLLAVIFSITDGFGLQQTLIELLTQFSEDSPEMTTIINYINGLLMQAENSSGGKLSLITFIWLVIWLMLCVERCFNTIWHVEVSRMLWKRLSSYLVIIILFPFLIVMFLSMAIILSDITDMILVIDVPFFDGKKVIMWIAFLVFSAGLFSVMFKVIPNAKVRWNAALWAAIPSAIAFVLVHYLYIETQIIVNRMSAIYGVFAAIPLFMLWVNLGWFIIVAGAQLSYSIQNIDKCDHKLSLRILKKRNKNE